MCDLVLPGDSPNIMWYVWLSVTCWLISQVLCLFTPMFFTVIVDIFQGGNLPYLTRCIKEPMRLHSPVPNVDTEFDIEGVTLPVGSRLCVNIEGLHHNKAVWEEDTKVTTVVIILTHTALKYFCINHENRMVIFNLTSFEYPCYGCTAIRNILLFQCGNRFYTSDSGV